MTIKKFKLYLAFMAIFLLPQFLQASAHSGNDGLNQIDPFEEAKKTTAFRQGKLKSKPQQYFEVLNDFGLHTPDIPIMSKKIREYLLPKLKPQSGETELTGGSGQEGRLRVAVLGGAFGIRAMEVLQQDECGRIDLYFNDIDDRHVTIFKTSFDNHQDQGDLHKNTRIFTNTGDCVKMMEDFQENDFFDLILCCNVFHFLTPHEISSLLKHMSRTVTTDGHIITMQSFGVPQDVRLALNPSNVLQKLEFSLLNLIKKGYETALAKNRIDEKIKSFFELFPFVSFSSLSCDFVQSHKADFPLMYKLLNPLDKKGSEIHLYQQLRTLFVPDLTLSRLAKSHDLTMKSRVHTDVFGESLVTAECGFSVTAFSKQQKAKALTEAQSTQIEHACDEYAIDRIKEFYSSLLTQNLKTMFYELTAVESTLSTLLLCEHGYDFSNATLMVFSGNAMVNKIIGSLVIIKEKD